MHLVCTLLIGAPSLAPLFPFMRKRPDTALTSPKLSALSPVICSWFLWFVYAVKVLSAIALVTKMLVFYAAPIGAFFCPEIRAFTGFGVRFLRQCLVTTKCCLHTKNGR